MSATYPTTAELRKAQERGARRHANAGIAQAIRGVLADEAGLSSTEIAERLGRDREGVKSALQHLVRSAGGVYSRGPKNKRQYFLFDRSQLKRAPQADPSRPFRVAGRITHGRGAFWGAGLA